MIIYSHETVPVVVDTTALLRQGESPSNVQTYLRRRDTDTDVTSLLTVMPTTNGNYVTQQVSNLVAGAEYLLTVTFKTNATTRRAVPVRIECPS